jgi:hypothetical protein
MLERVRAGCWGLDCTNWSGANYEDAEVTGFDQTVSHDFKIVWKADEMACYIDGQLMVTHTPDLPTVPLPSCSVSGAPTR